MRLNTHDRTPRPKMSKFLKIMFAIVGILMYGIFALVAFAVFYYGHSIGGGIFVLLLPLILTALGAIFLLDMSRAYVEIDGDEINVVDFYCFIKKEKHFTFSDIAKVKIISRYSPNPHGYMWRTALIQYIVLKNDRNKYLFKIIYTPETAKIFERYIDNGDN